MNILELLKTAGVEIDADKGEALNQALSALIEESVNEATTGLKSKNDELLGKLKDQKTAAQLAQEKADELSRKSMSNDELNSSWEAKHSAALAEKEKAIESIMGQMKAIKVDEVVARLSGELSDYPELIAPHIKSRLSMEQCEDGSFKTVVLTDGKMSALSLDELKKEISQSPNLAAAIKVNMGGAKTTETKVIENSQSKHTYNDMSQTERAAYIKQKYSAE